MTQPTEPVEADLEVVSLTRLYADEPAEKEKLRRACIQTGFFYLDLKSYKSLEADWYRLLRFSQEYFASPTKVKMEDARGSDLIGYEPMGTSAGVRPGTVDGYESLKFPHMQPVETADHPLSPTATQESVLVTDFISTVHAVLLKILASLPAPSDSCLQDLLAASHNPTAPSRSTLALFRYLKQPTSKAQGHNKHTDLGTLTFLLSLQPGLQVLAPGHEGWLNVIPRPGCAIINVGDSLRFLSGYQFRSAVHRVIPVAENQTRDRFSIAYFLRPNNEVRISTDELSGKAMTAQQWHDFKFDVFRQSHEQQERERFATGGMAKGEQLVLQV